MTAVLRTMPTLWRVSFARLVAYRAEMVIWILTATFPFVMLAMWTAVAAGGTVGGYGEPEFARYFTANLVVRQLTSSWVLWELAYSIRTGALSQRLLKPQHPLIFLGINVLAGVPFRLSVLAPLVVGLMVFFPEMMAVPDPVSLLLFVPCVFLAWLVGFCVQVFFATLAFWFDKTDSLFFAWFTIWSVGSGYIAPMALYPEWAQKILWYSPLRGMMGMPTELLAGSLSPQAALIDLGVQVGWAAVFVTVVLLTWRAGLKRYGAFGA